MTQMKHDFPSPPKVLEAVSVFVCPLESHAGMVQRLEQRWWAVLPPEEASKFLQDEIRLFHDDSWGEEVVAFGKDRMPQARVRPQVAWVPGHPWVALALEATVRPEDVAGSELLLDDLLTFNVGFRRTQGAPEPQDSFFGLEMADLQLADGRSSADLYTSQAHKIVGDNPQQLENLKKAVLLSYARFDRPLSDQELYRFGSVAYPQEPVTAEWSEGRTGHIFDRWKGAGWRCFAYSYSLVYALDAQYAGRGDARIRQRFLSDYVKMGVAIAMQRAWLQKFSQRLREVEGLQALRACHRELIDVQSRFGVRWTPEGTQRMQIEHMWRQASGVDDRFAEVVQLLEQKVDLLEAETTEQLNTKTERLNDTVFYLQPVFGLLAGAQVGVALQPTFFGLAKGALGGLLLGWLVPLLLRTLRKTRDE